MTDIRKYSMLTAELSKGKRPLLEETLPEAFAYLGTLGGARRGHEYTFDNPLTEKQVMSITKRLIELEAINWAFASVQKR